MSVDLHTAKYIPTIYLRPSELLAVSELPDKEKDLLTPIFCLKPWATSKFIDKSMEKILEVYPDRPFYLDIDPFYDKPAKRPAQQEFYELIEDEANNQKWVDFFEKFPDAFPCLQVKHGNIEAIRHQIKEFTAQERTFLVRIEHDGSFNSRNLVEVICDIDHANFGIVLDAGWSKDILGRMLWCDNLIKQIVDKRGSDIPIVTTGSSFPRDFTKYEMGQSVYLGERRLFNQLVAMNNQARLIYGDWASSRSPSEGGGGGKIPPRLELSTDNAWEIFRSSDEHEDFEHLAKILTQSAQYPRNLKIWATYMLDATKMGDPNGIDTLRKAAAVRINMHLYRQLHFDSFDPSPDTDDEYVE